MLINLYFLKCNNQFALYYIQCTPYYNDIQQLSLFELNLMKKEDEPDYEMFKQWFTQNGGLASNKIQFPKIFQPIGYTGMAAADNIKPNQVFLAIPKKIIISVSKVRDSVLGPVLQKYECLRNNQNEQTEFNIITLYLIWQKMLGTSSFFYPYLQAIGKAQTIIQWSDEDIQKLADPYITVEVVKQVRSQFPEIYKQFYHLSVSHPELFKQPISQDLFMDCYAYVMTRCFGWGLPETMMIPYADFLNHNCHGVNHYTFNRRLQQSKGKSEQQQEYIKKRKQIDLSLLGINNKAELPITYEMNSRQKFIYEHQDILENAGYKNKYDSQIRIYPKQTRQYLQTIHKQLMQETYNVDIYPSSNSEDNDSEQEQKSYQQTKQTMFKKQIQRLVDQELQHKFQQPKPSINRQFEDDVTFQWWKTAQEDSTYFIIATQRFYEKGEQIFNSYGRRNNKFLLIWYGFTHFNNKYDSVNFRFWDEQTYKKTGKYILVKTITQKDCNIYKQYKQQANFSSKNGNMNVTDQYRLKRDNLNYELMAYLRYRIIRKKQIFKSLLNKKLITIHKIHNLQLEKLMLDEYRFVLDNLSQAYNLGRQRQQLSNKYRNYFANILNNSNKQIILNHYKGINILINTLNKLQISKSKQKQKDMSQVLLDIYKGNLCQEQQEQQAPNMLKQMKYQNRKFVLDYFKMLGRYFGKVIKK